MIKEIFKYFAKFPAKSGVLAMANVGSQSPDYKALISDLQSTLPEQSILPSVAHYLYVQSFEELQDRLPHLPGTFLMVDYGEITMTTDGRRSVRGTMRLAVTIATRLDQRTDGLARLLASDATLHQVTTLYTHLITDVEKARFPYASRDTIYDSEIVPFVATELSASGWTLMLDITSPDPLNTHPQ